MTNVGIIGHIDHGKAIAETLVKKNNTVIIGLPEVEKTRIDIDGEIYELIENAHIMLTGHKNADFVVFNPGNAELTDIEPEIDQIKLPENDQFWTDIKSITWSSNCRYFLVVNESSIIIGNTLDNDAFCCQNLSSRFIEIFVNHYSKKF